MVSTIENSHGLLIGYIEWNMLDDRGQFSRNAEYIYIASCWIHEKYRHLGVLSKLTGIIYKHPFSQKSDKVYWDFVRINGKRLTDDTLPYFNNFKRMSEIYDKETLYNKITKGQTDDKRAISQAVSVQV